MAELVEHPRLWSYMLPGCEEHWLAAARPRMQALLEAQLGADVPDVRARGLAIDAILSLPAHSLVRVRGGVRRVQGAIRTRLRTVASAARTGARMPPAPAVALVIEPRDRSEETRWASQLAHAKELGERGNMRRCVATLTQSGAAEWSQERVEHMRKLHPAGTDALPQCPGDAPYAVFDKDDVAKLVQRLLHSTAAGPSGWTAELLAPLLGDAVCLDAVTLLAQLIANDELDEHSRQLLTCSVLQGIPKADSDDLRPLALGDLFVKIAAKLCFSLDARHFPAIFEPLQLAVCCPGGCERALQTEQAALEADPANIVIHVDSANAYNSVNRAQMLESVFADLRLKHTWRAFSFCYARPSLLLLREGGVLVHSVKSEQGVRQGCVLGGLGYAKVLQPAYAACARDRPRTTVRAIMDDLAICGPPAEAFAAYAKYVELATARDVVVNRAKTRVQQPAGVPTAETVRLALEHGLPILSGNHKYVGGYVGVDDLDGMRFVTAKLATQGPIMRAICDSAFPSHLALRLAKVHVLPRPMYLLRALPMRVTAEPMALFDAGLRAALARRLELPSILSPSALVSMTQPVGSGGMGLRALELIGPAAKWAAAAAVANDLTGFVAAAVAPRPFVLDREAAYNKLREAGVSVADSGCGTFADVPVSEDEKAAWGPYADPRLLVLPWSADNVHSFYRGDRRIPALQRMLSLRMEGLRLDAFLESADCTDADRIRIASCRSKHTCRWMFAHPQGVPLTDDQFAVSLRLRLGLPPLPFALPAVCPLCSKAADPWHPLACSAVRRRAVTTRHDRGMLLLVRYARSNGVLARFEPKDMGSRVPDGELIFPRKVVTVNMKGVHTLAPSHLRTSRRPGKAIERRGRAKHLKYDTDAKALGALFAALVVDSFGSLHDDFVKIVDEIEETATRGLGNPPPFRLTRETFLSLFSSQWQASNAAIIGQWLCLCQRLRLRGLSRRAVSQDAHAEDPREVDTVEDSEGSRGSDSASEGWGGALGLF